MKTAWHELTDNHLNDEIVVCSVARLMAEVCAMSRRPGIALYAIDEVKRALAEVRAHDIRVALRNAQERIQERIKYYEKQAVRQ